MLKVESISLAPKSQEASHMHQNQIHKEQAKQDNIQSGFAYQINHNAKQTVKSSKSENGDYLERNKEKNQKKKDNKENQKKLEKKKESNNATSNKGKALFDIKI